jgi:hypothetical protein
VFRWVQRFAPLLIDVHDPAGMPPPTGGSSTRRRSKSPTGMRTTQSQLITPV